MKKQSNLRLAIILAFVLGLFVIFARTPAPEPVINTVYDDEYKGYFMDGCVGEGGTNRFCSCVYDGLIEDYTIDEMLELYEDTDDSWMDEYITACL